MTDVSHPRAGTASPKPKPALWRGLGFQVVIGMVLGIVVGLIWPEFGASLKLLGDIFLRLIKTAVAPLVFLTVVAGIAAAGDFKRVGKVGLIATVYFEIISTIAIVFGLAAAYLFNVGLGMGQTTASAGAAKGAADAAKKAADSHTTFSQFFLNVFPDNFMGAFAKGELLQVLVIAIIFGAALLSLKPAKREPIESGLATISTAFFEFIHLIMKLAPIGTFGAVAYAVGANGTDVLIALAWLVLSFYLTIVAFIAIVLGTVCAIFKINLFGLLRYIKDEIIVVLGTASSESVLPKLLEKLPGYGASKQTVGLVMPTGYAFNLDGTSIYMGMGVVFLSHAYGITISWTQLGTLMAIMLLTSKGAATVSGGTFVVFAATVTASGFIPVEGLALLFGVYRFMSMAVATCNVVGNCVATIVTAKLCNEFDTAKAGLANRDPKAAEEQILREFEGGLPQHA
ncbi:cation:dicarboxylate symporter family transporter [Agrobacterium vitis]|uniref:cation:dicarboxylate symporter family transporter n=1 Tax=Agrobacterium vitis TaxID=373 RepID=UPI000871E89F|nr:cation:dicarboxylase symporter family transporter [Agrobacterium vitis]MCE6078380.1 cation:dicarboxylase symporter family transporter [Agrobacterium vitis]MCM2453333.1 cation:dicarboxylase symporter family transporter [Agrobacterium vitis]MCM2471792.1 cation:dicarboxylase symporter family transporter [Agrobacterium vitis]MUO73377.1 cation:dicarboxylase symporter family transporter [Agrobacterium vitis]MUO87576.1 cation:dicarboxylase symporter family transporter [Agrobacterium vitis]